MDEQGIKITFDKVAEIKKENEELIAGYFLARIISPEQDVILRSELICKLVDNYTEIVQLKGCIGAECGAEERLLILLEKSDQYINFDRGEVLI